MDCLTETMIGAFVKHLWIISLTRKDRRIFPCQDSTTGLHAAQAWICNSVEGSVQGWAEIMDGLVKCCERPEMIRIVDEQIKETIEQSDYSLEVQDVRELVELLESWHCPHFAAHVETIGVGLLGSSL